MVIFVLGLIAAIGRVIQLGGFGPINSVTNVLLEIIIEFVRVLIFLYVLGLASVRTGALRIKQFFRDSHSRKLYCSVALQKIKIKWADILLNFFGFIIISWLINYLVDVLAYQTCLYLTLKKNDIISQASSEWTIILFFKNISVIPFTLAFDALFLLWIINKYRGNTKVPAFQYE